ncbi:MAG: hypothetical protein WCE75_05375 [Terracidiphilus sp.]
MYHSTRIALAIACLCSISAVAQNAKSPEPKPSTSPIVTDAARIKALQEFWTPERLAAAKPMPLPRVDPSTVSANSAPAVAEPLHKSPPLLPTIRQDAAPEASSERFPLNTGSDAEADATPSPDAFSYEMPFNNFRTGINNQFPYSAMGKLFFAIPAGVPGEAPGEYVCSAAVVGNAYTVVTARHCMFDYSSRKWYSNWVFFPEWNNGGSSSVGGLTAGGAVAGQHGAWYPEIAITWTSGSSTVMSLTGGYDIGMFLMHDGTGTGCKGNKGRTIGSYTGALGWVYGGSNAQSQWNTFGYPQGAPFEGNYLYQNNGATGTVNPLGSNDVVEVGDPQTGGCSGGPWVIGFNPNNNPNINPNNNFLNGNNYDNGVNSFVWTNPAQPLAMNGTIFQSANFYNLWTAAQALTCN